jgi:hypothetical protein
MDVDPMDAVEDAAGERTAERDRAHARLNTWVALTIAIIATFTGICKVKDDNIVQAMQQAQADRIDHWNYYQAHNVRLEIARSAIAGLRLGAPVPVPAVGAARDSAIAYYAALVADQEAKKDSVRRQAVLDAGTYEALNYRDDQFDLSDALIAIAISLLALTALTHKRWLFWFAMVPTVLGVLMGLAGLLGWRLHPDTIARWLS